MKKFEERETSLNWYDDNGSEITRCYKRLSKIENGVRYYYEPLQKKFWASKKMSSFVLHWDIFDLNLAPSLIPCE